LGPSKIVSLSTLTLDLKSEREGMRAIEVVVGATRVVQVFVEVAVAD
jgi:hypothetical protein